jgi:hypothetical protein
LCSTQICDIPFLAEKRLEYEEELVEPVEVGDALRTVQARAGGAARAVDVHADVRPHLGHVRLAIALAEREEFSAAVFLFVWI